MIFTLKHLTACCVQRRSLMFCVPYKKVRCVKGGGGWIGRNKSEFQIKKAKASSERQE
jgi:hypothetical protein